MKQAVYIHEIAIACALGGDAESVQRNLFSAAPPPVNSAAELMDGRRVPVGVVQTEIADSGADSRCNVLADHLLKSLQPALACHEGKKLAVVIGTSTSGVGEGARAFRSYLADGAWPRDFRFSGQELGDVAAYVARRMGAQGPAYGISTACTSGAKALASAARLIGAGLCDIAIAGGIDSLCDLTLNGFAVLEALSDSVCNPFSVNRSGINLGEGGALFLLSSEPSDIRLAGWGESADAYHISAPDPEGIGAETAMLQALKRAGRSPRDIGYLNLHGTATKLNDLMEARAISRVFGADLPCSSTKPLTGHLLGAAGACEAAFAAMALKQGRLPAHIWDGETDHELPPVRLVSGEGEASDASLAMSCSYAFGGNNVALVLERPQ